MPTAQPWHRAGLHRIHSAVWIIGRWMLVMWGALNGLGLTLAGQVERVKRRISRRVPRVSGSGRA